MAASGVLQSTSPGAMMKAAGDNVCDMRMRCEVTFSRGELCSSTLCHAAWHASRLASSQPGNKTKSVAPACGIHFAPRPPAAAAAAPALSSINGGVCSVPTGNWRFLSLGCRRAAASAVPRPSPCCWSRAGAALERQGTRQGAFPRWSWSESGGRGAAWRGHAGRRYPALLVCTASRLIR